MFTKYTGDRIKYYRHNLTVYSVEYILPVSDWVGPSDPSGHTVPALLTHILFKVNPLGPLALNFWVGSVTRRADPAHSHPDSQLVSCQPVRDGASVQTADGTPCSITHQGSLCTSKFSVPAISFAPELSMNLMSVGQLADMNYFVGFDDSFCYVQDRQSKRVIGTGHRRRGSTSLYILDTLHLPSASTTSAFRMAASTSRSTSPFSFAQWHHRLGHLCGSRLSTLVRKVFWVMFP